MTLDVSQPTSIPSLLAFLAARFDEEQRQAGLFHELTCPAQAGSAGANAQYRSCRCRCPARLIAKAQTKGRIADDCTHTIAHQDQHGPAGPST